jgi:hypothetical protein
MLIEGPLSAHSPCWFDGSYCVRTGGRLPLASQLRFLTLLVRSPKARKSENGKPCNHESRERYVRSCGSAVQR